MTSRIAVVTGASSGLGLETSVQLAQLGFQVMMVGRNAEKTAGALARAQRGATGPAPTPLLCDFSSPAQTRALAAELLARCPRIDILVNNAGGVSARRRVTAEGIEMTFAVNHLGYYLLTRLLLDRIVGSTPARIVVVASAAHFFATLDFDDLGFERGYRIMRAYARSKLCNVLFARELARRLTGTGVTVNAVHPGGVATGIWDGAPGWMQPFLAVLKRFAMILPEAGARHIVRAATSPEVAGITGAFFDRERQREPSTLARDAGAAARLWKESARLVGLEPG